MTQHMTTREENVTIHAGLVELDGHLTVPSGASSLVIFAHGSGSSRHSPRNRFVAETLNDANIGTLLFDLLTAEEERAEMHTRHLRFDISMLSERLVGVLDWASEHGATKDLRAGLFGASTGAAAALVAAAERPDLVGAVVSRGGRPDLAGRALPLVKAPTMLIVGSKDTHVLDLNREAARSLQCETRVDVISGASHLFEEPGALEQVAELAAKWFQEHLRPRNGDDF